MFLSPAVVRQQQPFTSSLLERTYDAFEQPIQQQTQQQQQQQQQQLVVVLDDDNSSNKNGKNLLLKIQKLQNEFISIFVNDDNNNNVTHHQQHYDDNDNDENLLLQLSTKVRKLNNDLYNVFKDIEMILLNRGLGNCNNNNNKSKNDVLHENNIKEEHLHTSFIMLFIVRMIMKLSTIQQQQQQQQTIDDDSNSGRGGVGGEGGSSIAATMVNYNIRMILSSLRKTLISSIKLCLNYDYNKQYELFQLILNIEDNNNDISTTEKQQEDNNNNNNLALLSSSLLMQQKKREQQQNNADGTFNNSTSTNSKEEVHKYILELIPELKSFISSKQQQTSSSSSSPSNYDDDNSEAAARPIKRRRTITGEQQKRQQQRQGSRSLIKRNEETDFSTQQKWKVPFVYLMVHLVCLSVQSLEKEQLQQQQEDNNEENEDMIEEEIGHPYNNNNNNNNNHHHLHWDDDIVVTLQQILSSIQTLLFSKTDIQAGLALYALDVMNASTKESYNENDQLLQQQQQQQQLGGGGQIGTLLIMSSSSSSHHDNNNHSSNDYCPKLIPIIGITPYKLVHGLLQIGVLHWLCYSANIDSQYSWTAKCAHILLEYAYQFHDDDDDDNNNDNNADDDGNNSNVVNVINGGDGGGSNDATLGNISRQQQQQKQELYVGGKYGPKALAKFLMLKGNIDTDAYGYLDDLVKKNLAANKKRQQQQQQQQQAAAAAASMYTSSSEGNSRKRKSISLSVDDANGGSGGGGDMLLLETNVATTTTTATNLTDYNSSTVAEQTVPLREQLSSRGYPLLVQVEVNLNNGAHRQAIGIVGRMESLANAAGISDEEQMKGWLLILDYLLYTSQLFLDGNDSKSAGYSEKKILLQTIFSSMGNLGRNALLQYYKQLVEDFTSSELIQELRATNEEINYITKASKQTILRILLMKYDIEKSIEYFSETFPDVHIWGNYGGTTSGSTNDNGYQHNYNSNDDLCSWAINFLKLDSNPIPSSLIMPSDGKRRRRGRGGQGNSQGNQYKQADINILLNRSPTPPQQQEYYENDGYHIEEGGMVAPLEELEVANIQQQQEQQVLEPTAVVEDGRTILPLGSASEAGTSVAAVTGEQSSLPPQSPIGIDNTTTTAAVQLPAPLPQAALTASALSRLDATVASSQQQQPSPPQVAVENKEQVDDEKQADKPNQEQDEEEEDVHGTDSGSDVVEILDDSDDDQQQDARATGVRQREKNYEADDVFDSSEDDIRSHEGLSPSKERYNEDHSDVADEEVEKEQEATTSSDDYVGDGYQEDDGKEGDYHRDGNGAEDNAVAEELDEAEQRVESDHEEEEEEEDEHVDDDHVSEVERGYEADATHGYTEEEPSDAQYDSELDHIGGDRGRLRHPTIFPAAATRRGVSRSTSHRVARSSVRSSARSSARGNVFNQDGDIRQVYSDDMDAADELTTSEVEVHDEESAHGDENEHTAHDQNSSMAVEIERASTVVAAPNSEQRSLSTDMSVSHDGGGGEESPVIHGVGATDKVPVEEIDAGVCDDGDITPSSVLPDERPRSANQDDDKSRNAGNDDDDDTQVHSVHFDQNEETNDITNDNDLDDSNRLLVSRDATYGDNDNDDGEDLSEGREDTSQGDSGSLSQPSQNQQQQRVVNEVPVRQNSYEEGENTSAAVAPSDMALSYGEDVSQTRVHTNDNDNKEEKEANEKQEETEGGPHGETPTEVAGETSEARVEDAEFPDNKYGEDTKTQQNASHEEGAIRQQRVVSKVPDRWDSSHGEGDNTNASVAPSGLSFEDDISQMKPVEDNEEQGEDSEKIQLKSKNESESKASLADRGTAASSTNVFTAETNLSEVFGQEVAYHFEALGMRTVRELAEHRFFHLARALIAMAETETTGGRISGSRMNVDRAVVHDYETKSLKVIADAPADALEGLSAAAREIYKKLGIKTVRDLAVYKRWLWAESFVGLDGKHSENIVKQTKNSSTAAESPSSRALIDGQGVESDEHKNVKESVESPGRLSIVVASPSSSDDDEKDDNSDNEEAGKSFQQNAADLVGQAVNYASENAVNIETAAAPSEDRNSESVDKSVKETDVSTNKEANSASEGICEAEASHNESVEEEMQVAQEETSLPPFAEAGERASDKMDVEEDEKGGGSIEGNSGETASVHSKDGAAVQSGAGFEDTAKQVSQQRETLEEKPESGEDVSKDGSMISDEVEVEASSSVSIQPDGPAATENDNDAKAETRNERFDEDSVENEDNSKKNDETKEDGSVLSYGSDFSEGVRRSSRRRKTAVASVETASRASGRRRRVADSDHRGRSIEFSTQSPGDASVLSQDESTAKVASKQSKDGSMPLAIIAEENNENEAKAQAHDSDNDSKKRAGSSKTRNGPGHESRTASQENDGDSGEDEVISHDEEESKQEETIKKRRGRPPRRLKRTTREEEKEEDKEDPVLEESLPKTRRAGQRKKRSEKDSEAAEEKAKQQRDRPTRRRGHAEPEGTDNETVEPEVESTPKKRRGRPPKNAAAVKEETGNDEEESGRGVGDTIRKPRGRPPKKVTPAATETNNIDENQDEQIGEEVPAKRKRLRRRKNEDEESKEADEEASIGSQSAATRTSTRSKRSSTKPARPTVRSTRSNTTRSLRSRTKK